MRPVFQAAACEAPARADAIADASSGPSQGEAAARSVLTDRDDTPCYPFGILRPAIAPRSIPHKEASGQAVTSLRRSKAHSTDCGESACWQNRSVRTVSPQPPPGEGLRLYVASPSARLRDGFAAGIGPSGPSGPQPGSGGPLLLHVASVLRRLRPDFVILNLRPERAQRAAAACEAPETAATRFILSFPISARSPSCGRRSSSARSAPHSPPARRAGAATPRPGSESRV